MAERPSPSRMTSRRSRPGGLLTGRRPTATTLVAMTLAIATVTAGTGCGAAEGQPVGESGSRVTGTVTVLAAASLTESFTRIGRDFEAAHPGTRVVFSFAGSSTLAAQINQGAPADVFAAAAPANMRTVVDAGNIDDGPDVFAHNQLVIAVPRDNPARIGTLADLAAPGVTVALCAEQVPCGAAARRALAAAGVRVTPVTLERDVRGALTKVRLGEVDAALVYRTDIAAAAGAVTGIEFPEAASAVNDYPIAVVRGAPNPAGARAFVAHVRAEAGRAVLAAAGFQLP